MGGLPLRAPREARRGNWNGLPDFLIRKSCGIKYEMDQQGETFVHRHLHAMTTAPPVVTLCMSLTR
jgi:hypothetical protein